MSQASRLGIPSKRFACVRSAICEASRRSMACPCSTARKPQSLVRSGPIRSNSISRSACIFIVSAAHHLLLKTPVDRQRRQCKRSLWEHLIVGCQQSHQHDQLVRPRMPPALIARCSFCRLPHVLCEYNVKRSDPREYVQTTSEKHARGTQCLCSQIRLMHETSFNDDISRWDVGNVNSMEFMYVGRLERIYVQNFDASRAARLCLPAVG